MGQILSLLIVTLVIALVLFLVVCVCKVVYFIKRTKYIYRLRNKLKMQQNAVQCATDDAKAGENS